MYDIRKTQTPELHYTMKSLGSLEIYINLHHVLCENYDNEDSLNYTN